MLEPYISNAERLKDIGDSVGADVIIVNHTEYNDALNRLERTTARRPASLIRGSWARERSRSITRWLRNARNPG
jgi:hypothetical protein